MMRACLSGFLLILAAPVFAQEAPVTHGILECYPDDVLAAIEVRNRHLLRRPSGDMSMQTVVDTGLRWRAGATVTVAFKEGEGDPNLHRDIAAAAEEWTKHGNLRFDFGHDPKTGRYRAWSGKDTRYSADIRITFTLGGYWSVVGNDSVNPTIRDPNEPSMCLSGFHVSRPQDWRRVVLHEFGHALGFHHEHQSPRSGCDDEFRWDDDSGYILTRDGYGQFIADVAGRRPGIYTVLGGPPNEWPRSKVAFNLRQLQSSSGLSASEHDPLSIMHYAFPAWMFRRPDSPCCTESNDLLSDEDKAGMLRAYPRVPASIEKAEADWEKGVALLSGMGNDTEAAKEFVSHLESMADGK